MLLLILLSSDVILDLCENESVLRLESNPLDDVIVLVDIDVGDVTRVLLSSAE